jgi:hypothetical protein
MVEFTQEQCDFLNDLIAEEEEDEEEDEDETTD